MKILIVSQFYYPERFTVTNIAEKLFEMGHDVTVLTGKPNYGYGKIIDEYKNVKFETINGVKVHRVNLIARKDSRISIVKNYLSFHNNAKKFVKKWKEDFDVILSFSLSPVISIAPACLYAKKKSIKHVLYCEDLWPESTVITGAVKKGSLAYKILYKWSKSLYSKCDEIIVSSPSFVSYFEDVLNLGSKEMTFIPQPALLPAKVNEKVELEGKYNFVYAGNIGKIQLIDKVVEAFSLFENDDIKFYLIGMGSETKNIEKLIESKSLQNRVKFLGPKKVEEVAKYYNSADGLIVSLKDEGFVGKTIPNKLTQYMYYGKPIIGVVGGDGRKVIEEAFGGLISGSSAVEINKVLRDFIKLDNQQKSILGLNNKNYFDEHFELSKVAKDIEKELYKFSKK